MVGFGPASQVRICCDFLGYYKYDKCQTLHVGTCVPLIELYLFVPLLVTLTIFQGHSSVKKF